MDRGCTRRDSTNPLAPIRMDSPVCIPRGRGNRRTLGNKTKSENPRIAFTKLGSWSFYNLGFWVQFWDCGNNWSQNPSFQVAILVFKTIYKCDSLQDPSFVSAILGFILNPIPSILQAIMSCNPAILKRRSLEPLTYANQCRYSCLFHHIFPCL
jgi:hypothetical protein